MTDHERRARVRLVAQWRASGKSAREFARTHGVTAWTLYYWRGRLTSAQAASGGRDPGVGLVPVRVVPDRDPPTSGDLEVILATGDRLRVSADVATDTLRRVVQVLKAAC